MLCGGRGCCRVSNFKNWLRWASVMMPILQPLAVPDCVVEKGSISLAEESFIFSVTELQPCTRSLRMVSQGNGQLSASERLSLATSRYNLYQAWRGGHNALTISSPFFSIISSVILFLIFYKKNVLLCLPIM